MRIVIATLLLGFFFFAGCARFRPTQLQQQAIATTSSLVTTDLFEIQATELQEIDGSATARSLSQSFHLLSLSIKNKTATPITLDPTSITPEIATLEELKQHVPRLYNCYFLPAAVIGTAGLLFFWELGLPFASLLTLLGFNQSRMAVEQTEQSIAAHLLAATELHTIPAHTTSTMLVAIKHATYKPSLTMTLQTSEGEKNAILSLHKSTHSTFRLS